MLSPLASLRGLITILTRSLDCSPPASIPLVAVLNRLQVQTGIDLYAIADVAEERVLPLLEQPVRIDRDALILGYAGVYSSFLLFAQRAAARHGVAARDILVEMGRRKTGLKSM